MTVTIQTLEPLDVSVRNNGTVDVTALMGTLDADVAASVADALTARDEAQTARDEAAASATSAAAGATSSAASADSAAASAALAEEIVGLPSESAAIVYLTENDTDVQDALDARTQTVGDARYTPRGTSVADGIIIGNRTSAAGGSTRLLFELAVNRPDPDEVVMQHYSGYSFYTGTQDGTGSLQGGSDQATAYVSTGASLVGTVLGYEGIGEGNGDDPSGSLPGGVIGMQGTALVGGTPDIPLAVSLRASGVHESSAYTGTLTAARSFEAHEPTVGTTRHAVHATGASRFIKGSASNAVEVANASDTLQWSSNGTTLKGYASDGATAVVALDPQDAASIRSEVSLLGGTTKGYVSNDILGSGTGNHFEAKRGGSTVFAVKSDGTLDLTLAATATSPTNGSAGATPASPWFYAKAVINGNAVRIPCYYDF